MQKVRNLKVPRRLSMSELCWRLYFCLGYDSLRIDKKILSIHKVQIFDKSGNELGCECLGTPLSESLPLSFPTSTLLSIPTLDT